MVWLARQCRWKITFTRGVKARKSGKKGGENGSEKIQRPRNWTRRIAYGTCLYELFTHHDGVYELGTPHIK